MIKTSPWEEGDNGHNNQLGTKMAATVKTVVSCSGGNARWVAVVIMMDGSGKIMMDGGIGNRQWWCIWQQNGKTIAMGKAAQWETMQNGWQWKLQWMAAARIQWMVAAAMGNSGAMGRGTEKQVQWVMEWKRR
jgi:hypothetical protein